MDFKCSWPVNGQIAYPLVYYRTISRRIVKDVPLSICVIAPKSYYPKGGYQTNSSEEIKCIIAMKAFYSTINIWNIAQYRHLCARSNIANTSQYDRDDTDIVDMMSWKGWYCQFWYQKSTAKYQHQDFKLSPYQWKYYFIMLHTSSFYFKKMSYTTDQTHNHEFNAWDFNVLNSGTCSVVGKCRQALKQKVDAKVGHVLK